MLNAAECLGKAIDLDAQALQPMSDDERAHLLSMAATWRVMAAQSVTVDKLVAGLLRQSRPQ